MVCIPYTYGVKCAYSQVNRHTLCFFNYPVEPAAPVFFFRLPQGDAAKKRKKQRGKPATNETQRNFKRRQGRLIWGLAVAPIKRPLGQTKNTSHISGYIARVLVELAKI